MAGEPIVTYVGNVTSDPELKFLTSGKPVVNFTLAVNHRVKNGDTWEDGEPTWVRCAAWEGLAENIAESIKKGTRVIVQGAQSTRAYETKEGEKRTVLELRVDAIGPDLRFQVANVSRVKPGEKPKPAAQESTASSDPWASAGSATQGDEPPF